MKLKSNLIPGDKIKRLKPIPEMCQIEQIHAATCNTDKIYFFRGFCANELAVLKMFERMDGKFLVYD